MDIATRLAGTWEQVSYRRFRDGVFYRDTMGPGSSGRIIYSSSGCMTAFLLSAPWARGEKVTPGWPNFFAYSGRWELGDDAHVVHYVDMASMVDYIGTRLVRSYSWTDEGLLRLLTESHVTAEGHESVDELVWRKVADEAGR